MSKEQIIATWTAFEDADPDISTERLFEMTATACKCDVDDVASALWEDHKSMPSP